jgi:predicted transposase YbfD/YdcC
LAGAAQVARRRCHVQHLRQGRVIQETTHIEFVATSLWPEEASPTRLLGVRRSHWSIENRQFHRRDRTQREDVCRVRHPIAARNLSLFRSLAIFLFEAQARRPRGQRSLPDFQSHVHRHPTAILRRLTHARAAP